LLPKKDWLKETLRFLFYQLVFNYLF